MATPVRMFEDLINYFQIALALAYPNSIKMGYRVKPRFEEIGDEQQRTPGTTNFEGNPKKFVISGVR